MDFSTREWTIKAIKRGNEWKNDFGTFQSYSLALDGIGEPVQLNKKVPVSQEPNIGDKLYGSLEEKEGTNARIYYKFKSEARPPEQRSNSTAPTANKDWKSSEEYYGKKDASIRAQWAIGQATQLLSTKYGKDVLTAERAEKDFQLIEDTAKRYFAMVERVKADPVEESFNKPTTGYDKFKASKPSVTKTADQMADEDFAQSMAAGLEADGINLDDIPF